jgi:hypothetical protein
MNTLIAESAEDVGKLLARLLTAQLKPPKLGCLYDPTPLRISIGNVALTVDFKFNIADPGDPLYRIEGDLLPD